jgi:hypothetical protein
VVPEPTLTVSRARAGQMCGHGAHDAWVLCGYGMAYAPALDVWTWPREQVLGNCSRKGKLVLDEDVESLRVGVL